MTYTVQKVKTWAGQVEHKPGALAKALGPIANAGANLQMVMAYRSDAKPNSGMIICSPITGGKAIKAAKAVGLRPAPQSTMILVEGANRAGLGRDLTERIARGRINLLGCNATVIGNKFSAVFWFSNPASADKAAKLLRAAPTPKPEPAKKAATKKTTVKKKPAAKKKAKTTTRKRPVAKKKTTRRR